MPYYEEIRKDLREMLQRKKLLDRNLALLEDQIAKFEATYLEETPTGNIIRGFDNYIKGPAARRRNAIGDADRVFSMSSATSLKVAQQEAEASSSQSQSASASTPSTNQTDQKPLLQKKKTIKRRKGEDGSESPSDVETPGPKRVRISFSRQPT
ncbi:histone acetyltransferase subunit NuA4-domain-containing protein [Tirmania nivea]|nr:histone acetyltransferase subunit NuA4-domain-containing protein [Tirmania nivea]